MICGTPTPATTRVVQIEPGPTPTFTASAPASTSACAPARVATLPAITWTCRSRRVGLEPAHHVEQQPGLAVRGVGHEDVHAGLDQRGGPLPRVAPEPDGRGDPQPARESSLVAFGYCSDFTKSLTVISPRSRPLSSTIGSFSTLCLASSAAESSRLIPTGAVTSGIAVITSRTVRRSKSARRDEAQIAVGDDADQHRSSSSTTGTPEIRYRPHSASTSARVASGPTVTGWLTIPDSDRLTRSTWPACSSIDRLRCSTPMPPWRAIAIAIRASVTVSIAADTAARPA